jgi:hypothetical protein
LDASGWNELGKTEGLARLMYVKGYIQGYADGDSAMEKIAVVLTKNAPLDSSTKKLIEPQALRLADITGFGKNENVTVGKVDNAVSSFYGDYRNARYAGIRPCSFQYGHSTATLRQTKRWTRHERVGLKAVANDAPRQVSGHNSPT